LGAYFTVFHISVYSAASSSSSSSSVAFVPRPLSLEVWSSPCPAPDCLGNLANLHSSRLVHAAEFFIIVLFDRGSIHVRPGDSVYRANGSPTCVQASLLKRGRDNLDSFCFFPVSLYVRVRALVRVKGPQCAHVSVYRHRQVYVHVRMCARAPLQVCMCMGVCLCWCVCFCVSACMCNRVYVCRCRCMWMLMCMRKHVRMFCALACACACACPCACAYACACACACACVCRCAYACACAWAWPWSSWACAWAWAGGRLHSRRRSPTLLCALHVHLLAFMYLSGAMSLHLSLTVRLRKEVVVARR
jgi:hypothetical protein